jgi:hypothetical protein
LSAQLCWRCEAPLPKPWDSEIPVLDDAVIPPAPAPAQPAQPEQPDPVFPALRAASAPVPDPPPAPPAAVPDVGALFARLQEPPRNIRSLSWRQRALALLVVLCAAALLAWVVLDRHSAGPFGVNIGTFDNVAPPRAIDPPRPVLPNAAPLDRAAAPAAAPPAAAPAQPPVNTPWGPCTANIAALGLCSTPAPSPPRKE